ncbi:type 1 glutamine amidotransferase [Streptomyces sp. SID6673]|nr:type 1 glutamine amidotransferase [Streptomyces sp. SID11726]NEB24767.1 type 1 glutamine amidotransferase [Streptomyces sp. SID6673]
MTATQRIRVLELRHAEVETPGAYSTALDELADVETVRAWQEPLPDTMTGFDAIIVMGGPMGVGDADAIPWIASEIAFLRDAVAVGIPVWGVCLGSQLLAAALGADVFRGDVSEIGVREVTLNSDGIADPVWGATPSAAFETVQWHFDTFALPAGATLLAGSALYPNQLFRYGNSYGVQFHLEAGGALIRRWLHGESRNEVEAAIGRAAVDRFADDAANAEALTAPLSAAVMRRWLASVATHRTAW